MITTCRCGCGADVVPQLLHILRVIEVSCGAKVEVNSGARCEAHNARVGGKSRSYHLRGMAADIYISGWSSARLQDEVQRLFGGAVWSYRISWRSIHIDIRGVR